MRKGFTLIELLIVIAIMAILAGAMLPMFRVNQLTAQQASVRADLDSIKTAAIMYHQDTGQWPPGAIAPGDITGADFVTDAAPVTPNWAGPYLDQWGNDPWGTTAAPRPYRMINGGAVPVTLSVASYGNNNAAGGVAGTADEDIILLITPNRAL